VNSNIDNVIITEDAPAPDSLIIKDKSHLRPLIEEALRTSGNRVLDISDCKIEIDFNLAEILQEYLEYDLLLPSVKDPDFHNFIRQTIRCPFILKAKNAHFFKSFVTFYPDYSKRQYSDITFTEQVDFAGAIFEKNAEFIRCTFNEEALFFNTIFKGYAAFDSTTFKKGAMFATTTFHDAFLLSPKELQGKIEIQTPNLESDKRSLVVDLEQCSPESKGIVSFKNIEMDEKKTCIKLRNLKSDSGVKVHFTDCNFHGENVVLRHVDFEKINIEGGTLAKGFDFGYLDPTPLTITLGCLGFPIHCQFQAIHKNRKLPENKLKMWASIYANLKAKADEKGERQLGNDYFFWQQYFQRVEHQPPFCNFNEIYLCSSTYGLNFKLPLFYFTAYLFAFALFYMMTALHSFREGFLVSLSASIPFVFNDIDTIQNTIALIAIKENWWWFYPLYILQHLIQGYLLFQIGAAIRNKVKR
jgi:hypothetical protein